MRHLNRLILSFIIVFTVAFFNSCSKPDPCENISCLNGGYCANGECVCPQGYRGPDCSQQITPTKIRITKIEVTRFPATDNGAGWDLTSGPDISPRILLGNTIIWNGPNYYENATQGLVYSFTPSSAIELTNVNSQYSIDLYDYDTTSSSDFMGGIYFYPYSSTNKFPTVRTIDAGGTVAFKLYLSYVW
jgi:hypothetical protein